MLELVGTYVTNISALECSIALNVFLVYTIIHLKLSLKEARKNDARDKKTGRYKKNKKK